MEIFLMKPWRYVRAMAKSKKHRDEGKKAYLHYSAVVVKRRSK